MGLGSTLRYAYVGIFHPGECALAVGIRTIEVVIEIAKAKQIKIAIVLFLFSIFFLSFNFFPL
jgi:hypothetical protein